MKETDSYWELQQRIVEGFDELLLNWKEGLETYDKVEDVLAGMVTDENVNDKTYRACEKLWDDARVEDVYHQELEEEKWSGLQKDSGVY